MVAKGREGGGGEVELGVEVEEVGGEVGRERRRRETAESGGVGSAAEDGCRGCGGSGQGAGESVGGGGRHWRQIWSSIQNTQKYNTRKYAFYIYIYS